MFNVAQIGHMKVLLFLWLLLLEHGRAMLLELVEKAGLLTLHFDDLFEQDFSVGVNLDVEFVDQFLKRFAPLLRQRRLLRNQLQGK